MGVQVIALTLIAFLSAVSTIYAQELWGICPDKYKRYNHMHSYCLRPCCSCPFYKKDVSDDLKRHILYHHNSYRSKVAGGHAYGVDHLSRATNMLEMVWDDELAKIAQKWAYSCPLNKYDCDLCRMVDRFPVGQIVIEYEGKMDNKDLDMEFMNYFNGLSYVKKEHLSSFNDGDGKGRYSQLLWAKTWRIGCGFLYYHGSNGRPMSTLVCNYGPAGNIQGEEAYKAGSACSACPANSCCGKDCKKHGVEAKYNGLCKVIDINKPPEGDVPHKKTDKEIFYCAFNGESDCGYTVEGIDVWSTSKTTGGSKLSATINSGWTSTLHFTAPIKSKSGNVCIKVMTRKGPLEDKEYNYKMYGKVEKESRYMTSFGFPAVQEKTKHMYQIDYMQPQDYPKNEDVKLTLTFSVPYGTPSQYFEIYKIIVQDKKCKKVTTTEGSGYIIT